MKKLYIVKGVAYDSKNSSSLQKRVNSFVGYFSNLKEAYKNFDEKSVQSYSTIAKRLRDEGFYRAYNCKILIKPQTKFFNQIVIELVILNEIEFNYGSIDLSELISQEFSDFKNF